MKLKGKDYKYFVGTWKCIDTDCDEEKVYISKIDGGLSIKYSAEKKNYVELFSKSRVGKDIYYSFENKEDEMAYMIHLKTNGKIILNRGTTNPKKTGLSKPMEYKRISE